MAQKIILDCDPGHDDAIAMLLALGNPTIDLLAVTTTAGNQTLSKVTRNALSVATLAGAHDLLVAAGTHRGLLEPPFVAAAMHGESGLDGAQLPDPTVPLDPRHAVDVIIDIIMNAEPGEVTLVPTAPLTNIALAVRKEPRIVDRVAQVVLMGGAISGGNRSATSEFNIAADPEAAQIVFGERWPIVMVGLDVTHQALTTPDVVERLTRINSPASKFVTDLLAFFRQAYSDEQGFEAPPIHDACTVAYVIDPQVMNTTKAPVRVELQGEHTRGMTVVDLRAGAADGNCATRVAVSLNRERLWDIVIDAIESFSGESR